MSEKASQEGVNNTRRNLLIGAMTGVGAVGAGYFVVPFVKSWNPSAKAKAAGAPVKINIGKLEPGQMIVEEWQGKAVIIVRRTPEALENIKKLDGQLKDPMSDESKQPEYAKNEFRSLKDEYLVLVGICTHLGCSPKYRPGVGELDADWLGGFFCPCHGSKFDLAGRVYKGVPAAYNLEVPKYHFEADGVLVVGIDPQEVAA
jgi:ubiquinol-cytochrome c reductase iron-sulfur subunit